MKPLTALSIALYMTLASVSAAAQTAPAAGSSQKIKLDRNGDGAIDRAEAAAVPRFAEHFDRLDTNKDGRITADERRGRQGKRSGRHGGERGAGFARLDANGDGAIDRNEAAKQPRFAEHFDRLDTNKDGRITAEERPQHGQRGEGQGRQGMPKLDTDHDGRLSRAELAGKERALQNFEAIDANKDGYLTREEMRTYHQAHRGKASGGAR